MRRARPPRPYSRRLIPGTKLRAFKYRRSPARKIPHDERRSALHSAKIRESPGIAGAPFFPCMANARRVDFVSLSLSHSICLFFFVASLISYAARRERENRDRLPVTRNEQERDFAWWRYISVGHLRRARSSSCTPSRPPPPPSTPPVSSGALRAFIFVQRRVSYYVIGSRLITQSCISRQRIGN